MKKLLLLIIGMMLLTWVSIPASAQDDDIIFPAGLRFLDYNNKLPENLLYTKSVVFVSVPPKPGTSVWGDWKALSDQVHQSFRKSGVDAVAYYYFDDVEAGRDASRKLAAELKKREIQNIIILSNVKMQIAGKETERYALLITPFNGEESFISHGQQAYKEVSKTSEKLFSNFEKDVSRSGLEVQNHLISDMPEFFTGAGNVVKGKRAEGFAPDLKLDKLAVPRFEEADIPQNPPGGNANKNLEKEIEKANKKVDRDNLTLKSMMAAYPYEYSLVDPRLDEDRLRQDGYQFILLRLHTTGAHIKDMLGYEMKPDENEYITLKQDGNKSTLRHIPARAPVYKYYIKHIYTGDVYLGTPWDADEDWEDALTNYINNMKRDLNIGR